MALGMKKIIFLLLACCGFTFSAQNTGVPTGVRLSPPVKVPSIVLDRFRQDFPRANASWINEGEEGFVASFKDDSTQLPRMILYSNSGQRLESRKRMESGNYPKLIDKYYINDDPTAQYVVWRHDIAEKPSNFYGIVKADTSWFDDRGNLLRHLEGQQVESMMANADMQLLRSLARINAGRQALAQLATQSEEERTRAAGARLADTAALFEHKIKMLALRKQMSLKTEQSEEEKETFETISQKKGEELFRAFTKEWRRLDKELKRELKRTAKKARDIEFKTWAARHKE